MLKIFMDAFVMKPFVDPSMDFGIIINETANLLVNESKTYQYEIDRSLLWYGVILYGYNGRSSLETPMNAIAEYGEMLHSYSADYGELVLGFGSINTNQWQLYFSRIGGGSRPSSTRRFSFAAVFLYQPS